MSAAAEHLFDPIPSLLGVKVIDVDAHLTEPVGQPGCVVRAARLALMDELGIWAQRTTYPWR